MSITLGTNFLISGEICLSNNSRYSFRDSSTLTSIYRKMSSPNESGSGVSLSSAHSSLGFLHASNTAPAGKS